MLYLHIDSLSLMTTIYQFDSYASLYRYIRYAIYGRNANGTITYKDGWYQALLSSTRFYVTLHNMHDRIVLSPRRMMHPSDEEREQSRFHIKGYVRDKRRTHHQRWKESRHGYKQGLIPAWYDEPSLRKKAMRDVCSLYDDPFKRCMQRSWKQYRKTQYRD